MVDKGKIYLIRVSDASFSQEEKLVAGEMIIIAKKKNKRVSSIYWKSKEMSKACISLKAV